ncbi:MAG TPA: hypothetical protein DIT58_00060 [Porticoccaceae bacterium]|nr:hypothetical protein [Porticoccaceae bacterium]
MSIIETHDLGTVKVIKHEGYYATLLLNRPDVLNAMNPQLLEDLGKACELIETDPDIRAVVLTGAGRAFCAGGDIHEDVDPLRHMNPTGFNKYLGDAMTTYRNLMNLDAPLIAAVNGHAVGGGFDILLCCDIRIASENAQLGEFFVRMGLVPEAGNILLPRLVSIGWAKLLAFTGDLIDGKKAEQIGLVEQCVPQEELLPTAEALAKRLAAGPKSISAIKKAINESYDMSFEAACDHTLRLQYQMVHTQDHAEAVAAFLEKRKPKFQGQ